MASQLINLNQLRTAVTSIKSYADKRYERLGHNHNDVYATFDYVDNAIQSFEDELNDKAIKDHTHTSMDINSLKDYSMASEYSHIVSSDSLNEAIGKLEFAASNAADKEHRHDGVYLGVKETAIAAKRLEQPVEISLTGEVTGEAAFDGSDNISISATVSNLSSEKISSLNGYSKPDSISAIEQQDSLNIAIGKLERALDGKQNIGDIDVEELKGYVDSEILKVKGEDLIDSLDTLKELSEAINNDPDFHNSVSTAISKKADEKHEHELVTDTAHGYMSSDDKIKLDTIESEANNYIHPDSAGNKHIPAGGGLGQILIWSDDGVAQWAEVTASSASDEEVQNILDQIFPLGDSNEEN